MQHFPNENGRNEDTLLAGGSQGALASRGGPRLCSWCSPSGAYFLGTADISGDAAQLPLPANLNS